MPAALTELPAGGVATPAGFEAAGVACGLKPSGALDFGILASRRRATSALVDTASALPAESVVYTRSLDPERLQAVAVNAGNANAATGEAGVRDAAAMGAAAARAIGAEQGEVAVCSTGVIGERFDMDRVLIGAARAGAALAPEGGGDFAAAICTTDRAPKTGAWRLDLASGRSVLIGAAAKGAGMISPSMATMLAYVTTDAAIDRRVLSPVTRRAAAGSFNRISVDGQMSPSDTLIVLANGDGERLVGEDADAFEAALTAICRRLAVQIVKDGEGADHAVRLLVTGAHDGEEAELVARAIADSPLVKTAAFGRDPNWGRVSRAVGAALAGRGGQPVVLTVAYDGVPAGDPGTAEVLARAEYEMAVGLGRGQGSAEVFFSDLTSAYVHLNAAYRT